MTRVAIHQPQYLPWLPYFDKLDRADVLVLLDDVNFHKRGVQNRNAIRAGGESLMLSVPVHGSQNTVLRDVAIANEQDWVRKHLRSIEQSYARAPCARLIGQLQAILEQGHARLIDLCREVTQWMCGVLEIECRMVSASEFRSSGSKQDHIIELCRAVGGQTYVSGTGAREYQDEAVFAAAGLTLEYQQYTNPVYEQFSPDGAFVANLSALDLILNHGSASREIMLSGRTQ